MSQRFCRPEGSPAAGQVEGDAPADGIAKAHVADSAQADVEERHDEHAQVEHGVEVLRLLHLVLQRKDLQGGAHTFPDQLLGCAAPPEPLKT